ncbi:MAG: hypothetical protein U5J97_08940 [Trueperaceae bacterium]|nr:hypothetical protein [Trueperaceae bacterium]
MSRRRHRPPGGRADGRSPTVQRIVRVATVLAVVLACAGIAAAETVQIDTGGDPEARLELRTVVLPGGEQRELYVVSAERVVVTRGDLVLIASRLEFDPDAGVVRIVGRGRVERPGDVLVGDDLVVQLDDGRLDGGDVLVITDRVDVRGERAQRVEGRIHLLEGRFSPCGRCGQEIEDYAFVADRIEILPGDRLIAWQVVVLIRDAPFVALPLLVLPLAEPARIPRLEIVRGGEDAQAEIAVDWPYVSGPNAFGTFRARLIIDVEPDQGGPVGDRLLGGRPERAYLAGGFDHRFYDERGAGRIEVDYRPRFASERSDDPATTDPELRFEARYDSDAAAGDPVVSVRLARDDDARPNLVEAEASVAAHAGGFRTEASSRVAIPLEAGVTTRPSWDGSRTPRTAPVRLRAEGEEAFPFRAGALTLDRLSVDVGVFEDAPDPTNRSAVALGRPFVTAGRAELAHGLTLAPVDVAGVELSGRTSFVGRYYDTGERQIDWDSELRARRSLGDLGSVELRLRRDAAEGETPFAFDRIPLRSRSDLVASLSLRPLPGTRLSAEGGWLLEDDRAPDEVGLLPTTVRLEAFTNVRAIDLSLVHEADPAEGDLGTARLRLDVRVPSSAWTARLEADALLDLDPAKSPGRFDDAPRDTSRAEATASLGATDLLVAKASGGFEVEPVRNPESFWTPLELSATLGTLAADDARPGLEAFWTFDPDDGETEEAGYRFAVDLGPVRGEIEQRFGPPGGAPGRHSFAVVWRDLGRVTVDGVELVPASWLGLEPDPAAIRRLSVRVEDTGSVPGARFRAEYRTSLVPRGDEVVRQGTRFEATLRLSERRFASGLVRAAVDAFVDVPLPDDGQPTAYLRRANLQLGLDVAGRVGLQGTFGYRGSYDVTTESVRSGRLSFEEVSLVVRATNELYLGATLDDVWEIVDDDPASDLALDPRPTLFATWDRCCWALYTSWDTRSGEVVLTLGAPGRSEGPQFTLDQGPSIPWGEEGAAP